MPTHTLSPSSHGLRIPLSLGGSDEALSRRAAGGEAAAFAKLYERHHQPLYRYCRSIVRHDQDAQDALHNTMLRAWEAIQGEERDVQVRPWLFRIARNESISLLRRRRPTEELDTAQGVEALAVEDQAETRQELGTLVSDLGELPDGQRSALVLRELCGFSHEEIAAVHGGSASTAKQTIFAAREGLHDFSEGRAMSCASVKRLLSDEDRRKHRGRKLRAHLRACEDCSSFQTELRERPQALAAISPALPAAAASSLLAGILSHGSHGAAAGGSAAGASAVGGGALLAKVAVGAAIVATAGVGAVKGVDPLSNQHRKASSAASDRTAASGTAAAVRQGFARAQQRAASLRVSSTAQGRPRTGKKRSGSHRSSGSVGQTGSGHAGVQRGNSENHAAAGRGLENGRRRTGSSGRRSATTPSHRRTPAQVRGRSHQKAKPAPTPVTHEQPIRPVEPEAPAGTAPAHGKAP